jgi:hypothetical protein
VGAIYLTFCSSTEWTCIDFASTAPMTISDDSYCSNHACLSTCLSIYLSDCLSICVDFPTLSVIRTVVQALIDVLGNPAELLRAHTSFPHSPGLATLVTRLGSASLSGTGGRGTSIVTSHACQLIQLCRSQLLFI